MSRVVQSLGWVLAVCVGVRVAAWLVAPLLPALGGLFLFALLASWLLSGGRSLR